MSADYGAIGMAVGGFSVSVATAIWGYIKKPKTTIREIPAPKTTPDMAHIAIIWVNFSRFFPDVEGEIETISAEVFRVYRKMYMEFLKATGINHSGIQDNKLVRWYEGELDIIIMRYIQPMLRKSVYRNGLIHSEGIDQTVYNKLLTGHFIAKGECEVYDWYYGKFRLIERVMMTVLSKRWSDERSFVSFSQYCKAGATNEIIHALIEFYDNCVSKRNDIIADMKTHDATILEQKVILSWEEHFNKMNTGGTVKYR